MAGAFNLTAAQPPMKIYFNPRISKQFNTAAVLWNRAGLALDGAGGLSRKGWRVDAMAAAVRDRAGPFELEHFQVRFWAAPRYRVCMRTRFLLERRSAHRQNPAPQGRHSLARHVSAG